jgi:hypothetical protein
VIAGNRPPECYFSKSEGLSTAKKTKSSFSHLSEDNALKSKLAP